MTDDGMRNRLIDLATVVVVVFGVVWLVGRIALVPEPWLSIVTALVDTAALVVALQALRI